MVISAKVMACFSAFAAGKAEIFVEPVIRPEHRFAPAQSQPLGAALSMVKNPPCQNRTYGAIAIASPGQGRRKVCGVTTR